MSDSIIAAIESTAPHLWALCCPRAYVGAGAWHSARLPAAAAATAVHVAVGGAERLSTSERLHYACACALARHGTPTYFVGRTLLEAVARTTPPEIPWADMPMPFPAVTLMLPRDIVRHPRDGSIAALTIARISAAEPLSHPFPGSPSLGLREGNLIVTAVAENPRLTMYDMSLHPGTHPLVSDAEGIASGVSVSRAEEIALHGPLPLPEEDRAWQAALMSLALRLVLVMGARPELIGSGARKRPADPAKRAAELWTPNIIGERYRVEVSTPTADAAGGSHSSPRLHWRRGHYRAQAHGEGRALRRIIWLEPVLVGGSGKSY